MRNTCDCCGNYFHTHRGFHKFCSRECKDKMRIRINAHREKPREKYNYCLICGEKNNRYSRGAKTCSNKDCQNKHRGNVRKKLKDKQQKEFWKWKTEKGCYICGYNKHGLALDLHHMFEKGINFPEKQWVQNWWSWYKYNNQRIARELAKCIILCANCHRLVTKVYKAYGNTHPIQDHVTWCNSVVDNTIIHYNYRENLRKSVATFYKKIIKEELGIA